MRADRAMSPRTAPLGMVKYVVHYQKPCGKKQTCTIEVENNSMATTNLVYDFIELYPGCKIIEYAAVQNQDTMRAASISRCRENDGL